MDRRECRTGFLWSDDTLRQLPASRMTVCTALPRIGWLLTQTRNAAWFAIENSDDQKRPSSAGAEPGQRGEGRDTEHSCTNRQGDHIQQAGGNLCSSAPIRKGRQTNQQEHDH